MVSQVERYYPRTRRAVGPVSQTDRFYDDTRNDVRCPYADELGELDEVKKHLGRKDNPHGVTAEQVGAVPRSDLEGIELGSAKTTANIYTTLQKLIAALKGEGAA